jgi:trk system potassium uptake protein TrkA
VERDFRIAQEAQHTLGEQVLHGDGCDPKVLEQAGVAQADVVLALTGDDEDNLVVAELAHRFFGVKCVLARVNDPDNEWLFRPERGVHGSISPASIVADLVEQAVDRQAGGP